MRFDLWGGERLRIDCGSTADRPCILSNVALQSLPTTTTARQRWVRRAVREGEARARYGFASGASNCLSCGAFKSEPAAVCSLCGDDPVTFNGDRHDFNRAYGRAA